MASLTRRAHPAPPLSSLSFLAAVKPKGSTICDYFLGKFYPDDACYNDRVLFPM